MGYIRKSCEKRMADLLNALGGNSTYLSDEEASYACVEELKRIVGDVGIPQTLNAFDIPVTAVQSLTEDGVKQKRLLARSPLPLEKKDIQTLYQSAFDGAIVEPE